VAVVPIHVAEPADTVMIGTAVKLDDHSEFFIVNISLVSEA
jgi:hypothetical protein